MPYDPNDTFIGGYRPYVEMQQQADKSKLDQSLLSQALTQGDQRFQQDTQQRDIQNQMSQSLLGEQLQNASVDVKEHAMRFQQMTALVDGMKQNNEYLKSFQPLEIIAKRTQNNLGDSQLKFYNDTSEMHQGLIGADLESKLTANTSAQDQLDFNRETMPLMRGKMIQSNDNLFRTGSLIDQQIASMKQDAQLQQLMKTEQALKLADGMHPQLRQMFGQEVGKDNPVFKVLNEHPELYNEENWSTATGKLQRTAMSDPTVGPILSATAIGITPENYQMLKSTLKGADGKSVDLDSIMRKIIEKASLPTPYVAPSGTPKVQTKTQGTGPVGSAGPPNVGSPVVGESTPQDNTNAPIQTGMSDLLNKSFAYSNTQPDLNDKPSAGMVGAKGVKEYRNAAPTNNLFSDARKVGDMVVTQVGENTKSTRLIPPPMYTALHDAYILHDPTATEGQNLYFKNVVESLGQSLSKPGDINGQPVDDSSVGSISASSNQPLSEQISKMKTAKQSTTEPSPVDIRNQALSSGKLTANQRSTLATLFKNVGVPLQ